MSLSEILKDKPMRSDSLIICTEATIAKNGWRKKFGQLERGKRYLVEYQDVDPEIVRTFLVYGYKPFLDHPLSGKNKHELDFSLFLEKGERGGGAFEIYVYNLLKDVFDGGTNSRVRYFELAGNREYISGEIDVLVLTDVDKWNSFLDSYPKVQRNPLA